MPPLVLRALRRQGRKGLRFSDGYGTWDEARAASTGYDLPSILEKTAQASLKVKRGEAASERDSVLLDEIEYTWPALAGLMWVAARNGGRLGVLDFGGSLGTSYFQNRKFLDPLSVRWSIVEQAHFVAAGRRDFEDERLRFYDSVDDAVAAGRPDAVLLGGVLQYLEHPYALLERLAAIPPELMILDRMPFSDLDDDRISVQHVPAEIYRASYPSHVFSLRKFREWVASQGWTVMELYDCAEGSMRTDSGLEFRFIGALLRR